MRRSSGDENRGAASARRLPSRSARHHESGDIEHARRVARKLRAGNVHLNGAGPDFHACFGGYKQSGNGRGWGEFGFEDFLEVKAIMGAE